MLIDVERAKEDFQVRDSADKLKQTKIATHPQMNESKLVNGIRAHGIESGLYNNLSIVGLNHILAKFYYFVLFLFLSCFWLRHSHLLILF